MNKIAIVIHGGAGPDSDYIKQNTKEYKKGLQEATNEAYTMLEEGSSAGARCLLYYGASVFNL